MHLLFFIRKDKKKDGKAPLHLRITIDKKVAELSMNETVDAIKWHPKRQLMNGKTEDCISINNKIDAKRTEIRNLSVKLQEQGKLITAELLKSHLTGKNTELKKTVLEIYDTYSRKRQIEYNTVRKYKYTRKNLVDFMLKNYGNSDMNVTEINFAFVEGFWNYMLTLGENNHAVKTLQMFKFSVTDYARKLGLINIDPFIDFNKKPIPKEQIALTEEEMKTILKKDFENDSLNTIRDLFIFGCCTATSYCDMAELTINNLVNSIDGGKSLEYSRKKTGVNCSVPLWQEPIDIINRYRNHPKIVSGKLLPVISNQKMNLYLKDILNLAIPGSKKVLTTHVMRRTFATMAINRGMAATTVITVMGHSSFRFYHLYAKQDKRKIESDMQSLGMALAM